MQATATIIAQCTPSGSGALALMRISGPLAVCVADAIAQIPGAKKLIDQPTHTIHYGFVVNRSGEHIDQVLFLLMRAPKTFTGEDTVEITCHNNPFIIKNIIDAACAAGARVAQKGEFSRQAVENDKLDLVQVEAINDLIHAHTQTALKAALGQVKGSFSSIIINCEKKLIKALAFSEASFEFIDEELGFVDQIRQQVEQVYTTTIELQRSFDAQQHIKNGIRIALIGSVNAGKSSLFNALLGQERAIVTDIAGTTRDTIEAGRYADGMYQTLIDTAGLRQTDDVVEQKGIERSFEQAATADIVLLVFDGSRTLSHQEANVYQLIIDRYISKIIFVRSKDDLLCNGVAQGQFIAPGSISVSVSDYVSIATLNEAIKQKAEALVALGDSPYLLNQRHHQLIASLQEHLVLIMDLLVEPVHYELISYHLNEAITLLSGLTGKSVSEEGMDAVFRQFCVGK